MSSSLIPIRKTDHKHFKRNAISDSRGPLAISGHVVAKVMRQPLERRLLEDSDYLSITEDWQDTEPRW